MDTGLRRYDECAGVMRTLGLLGGMSWESTATYYKLINEAVQAKLGGLHSAKIILHSFDFAEIAALQKQGNWKAAEQQLTQAAIHLKNAGADAIVICTNTMHLMADEVEQGAGIPLIHIADATGEEIKAAGKDCIGLLGTMFTMEKPFYRERIEQKFGIKVLVPSETDKSVVNHVIYDELCKGIVHQKSAELFIKIMDDLVMRGANGIILGCTEIGMLIKQDRVKHIPLFDTTLIHAKKALDYALH